MRRSELQNLPEFIEDEEEARVPGFSVRYCFDERREQFGHRVGTHRLSVHGALETVIDPLGERRTTSAAEAVDRRLETAEESKLQRLARPGNHDGQQEGYLFPRRVELLSKIGIAGPQELAGEGIPRNALAAEKLRCEQCEGGFPGTVGTSQGPCASGTIPESCRRQTLERAASTGSDQVALQSVGVSEVLL